MSKSSVEVQELFDDVIQRCDTLLKNNFDKFLDYAKHQEVLRLEFIKTSDDYKYLKTWLDKACEDIITLQSEQSDLSKLYEVLMRKDCVKKFYDYVKDLEALKLNLAESIHKYKNLNRMMNTANVDIILLKSEFKDFIKGYKASLQKTVVKELLDTQQETLRLKFIDKINDCERLKASLDSAFKSTVVLRSSHDDLLKRYRELSENNIVKEFIDTAKNQETTRSESSENPNESGCSKASLEGTKKQIASLNLQLEEACKMLNLERQRREQIEKERDSSAHLSDGLCSVLLNDQQNESDDVRQNQSAPSSVNASVRSPSHQSNSNVESDPSPISEVNETESKNHNGIDFIEIPCDSVERNRHLSYLNEEDDEPVAIKEEKVDALPVTPVNPADKLTECSSLPCEDDRLFQNEPHETPSSSTTKNGGVSFVAIENLSLIDRLLLCKRSNNHFKSSSVESKQEPVIKKKPTAGSNDTPLESSTADSDDNNPSSEKHKIPDRRKLRERKAKTHSAVKLSRSKHKSRFNSDNDEKSTPTKTSESKTKKVVVEVLFSCERCGKSFVVKPNEKKLRICPLCDLIGARRRVGEGNNASTLKMTYGSVYEVRKYQCRICDREFLENSLLTRHIRDMHVKERPFKCGECKKAYTTKFKLNKHTRMMHISKGSLESSIRNARRLEGSSSENQYDNGHRKSVANRTRRHT